MGYVKTIAEGLKGMPAFGIEVLTAAELDAVAGGEFYSNDATLGGDCSCTVSQCHIDGNNEPGTS